ncbi:MAG: hypothetical protein LCI00_15175 [Chloroflexi bacterium]|nr:hypothetical protein [Chloroflexota bacterium]MCC6892640.1 hypothetical protein [Anaerolineae bacterium]
MAIAHLPAYDEFIEFITSTPTVEQVSQLRFSASTEARVSELLQANREQTITPEETVELDEYLRLERIMRKAKIRAIEKLDQHQ